MGKKDKLISRLKSKPKDFTFEELQMLLTALGFEINNAGKTSGSAVKFINDNSVIFMHKPHPRNALLEYQIKNVLNTLKEGGFIK